MTSPRSLLLAAVSAVTVLHCAAPSVDEAAGLSGREDESAASGTGAPSGVAGDGPSNPGEAPEGRPGGGGGAQPDSGAPAPPPAVGPPSSTVVVTSPTAVNAIAASMNGVAGTSTVTLSRADLFAAGQRILIHQSAGVGAGSWEHATIASVSGSTATLSQPLARSYTTSSTTYPFDRAQAVVVAEYPGDLTIGSGGVLSAPPWNGTTGGILALRAAAKVTVSTTGGITMAGRGFDGGIGGTIDWNSAALYAQPGASYLTRGPESCMWVPCSAQRRAMWGGGGGGAKRSGYPGAGGAGGGHATRGSDGGGHGSLLGGLGGDTYGEVTTLSLGSGGGAGGYSAEPAKGRGGAGGGVVVIEASEIALGAPGAIDARGAAGTSEYSTPDGVGHGGGGGGSGGTVHLVHTAGISGRANVNVSGGAGGGVRLAGDTQRGGTGGLGRVYVSP